MKLRAEFVRNQHATAQKKTLKFRESLVPLVLAGEKYASWRLFDDKDLTEGDTIELLNWNTGEKFADAVLTSVWEKKMKDINGIDFDGHEKFSSSEELYATYRAYYGDCVGPETVVKIIRFRLT